ncbi:AMP-binding protein [Desulfocarbo indianensis]|nr:AMP-binding protein [Desulfocarbo indianensis]
MNLACNLERSALFLGHNLAVWDAGRGYDYAELDRLAGLAGAGLKKLGIRPGDKVALCAPNSVDWLAFYFGALKAGAVAVTLSHLLSPRELELLLAHARPRALFTTGQRRAELSASQARQDLPWIICPEGDLDFNALLQKAAAPLAALERDPQDPACVLYTGGTTGAPKGVVLSHENAVSAVLNVAHHERSTHEDRALCFLPFNHVFGQMHIMNATVASGGGLVLLPGFDLERVLGVIAEQKVTKLYAVPTVYVRLLQVPDLKAGLAQVRYCFSAAASMAREVVLQWRQLTGLDIHEAYGMTETASLVTYNHYHRHKAGSVGTPAGSVEVCIQDAAGNSLPAGQEGEICVRGRNVMQGYLDNPQATAEALKGGWLHSGDVGYLDEEGYLFIVDRLKDLIISGGENVYPREVEEVLYQRAEVAECSVIGLPDAEYGERVTAYLVLKPGAELDPAGLKAFCRERLASFKSPKEFVAVASLPTSPAGKILKRELRRSVTQK